MRLTYVFHSCYVVEAANFTMIIDYYQDSIDELKGVVHDRLLHRPQRLYILSSHGHHDHFNPEVLKWREDRSDIVYIFSEDIRKMLDDDSQQNINFVSRGSTFQDDMIKLDAYGSTDLGVSFKITRGDNVLFHAGDLNNWHWNEESTAEEIKEAESFFYQELEYVAASTPAIGLAMFPVDPRLGRDYMKGAEEFLAKIPTKLFAPMHFGLAYDKALAIEVVAARYKTEVFVPKRKGDVYNGEV